MAYATKYRVQFQDFLKLNWKILIQEDAWAGDITELTATGEPLRIEFDSSGDTYNDPIRTSKAVFNVWSFADFQLLDFYSDQDFKFKVVVYCGVNIYWSGFIITGEYQEPYDCTPYPVTVTAIDGLSYLKGLLYKYKTVVEDDTYFEGRTLESQIIIDILAKIQIPGTAGDPIFTEYVNLYETAMLHTTAHSPLDQIKLDVDIFQDMYCYEVLTEILKKYDACIRQVEGSIVIYRPVELIQATINGRIFTGAITKSSTSFAPAQNISRKVAYFDYFLPSNDELNAMYTELHLHGLGGFTTTGYWSSSEQSSTGAYRLNFNGGGLGYTVKYNANMVRACRAFTSTTNYNLRDIGPAGGYIFWKSGNDYLESAPIGQSASQSWSNIVNLEIGVTAQGTAIGTGQANTTAIINQASHITSAAKLCDELLVWVLNDTKLRQFPGSIIMVKRPAKKITLSQDYGYKDSWINNWELKANTIDYYTSSLLGWSRGNSCIPFSIQLADKSQIDGMIPSSHNSYPTLNKYMYQSFGTYAKSTVDVFVIEFDYLIGNVSGGAEVGQHFYVEIKADGGNYWLYDINEEYCEWDNAQNYIDIVSDAPIGSTGWVSFSRKFIGIPLAGSYTIKLFGADDFTPLINIGFKNIRFYSTSDEIVVKRWQHKGPFPKLARWILRTPKYIRTYFDNQEVVGKEITVTNAINGIDMVEPFLLGDVIDSNIDNVIEQFGGALTVVVTTGGGAGAVARIDQITKDATTSMALVTINGHQRPMYWNTSESQSIIDFIANYGTAFGDITLNHAGVDTHFTATANVAGVDFIGPTLIDLGSVTTLTANNTGAGASTTIVPTMAWNTLSPGGENTELLKLIANEMLLQYSRPKQLIQMNIQEMDATDSVLNILGNIQDSLNTLSGGNRVFVFNRGELDVKNRLWNADILEIVSAVPSGSDYLCTSAGDRMRTSIGEYLTIHT